MKFVGSPQVYKSFFLVLHFPPTQKHTDKLTGPTKLALEFVSEVREIGP